MTGPRGGETCHTAGGLRRVNISLDEVSIKAIDAEVKVLRQRGRTSASRSEVIRRLANSLRKTP